AMVVSAFLVLVALDLNGSSVANLGRPWDDKQVIAGDARWIRSDEGIIQTPNSSRAGGGALDPPRRVDNPDAQLDRHRPPRPAGAAVVRAGEGAAAGRD